MLISFLHIESSKQSDDSTESIRVPISYHNFVITKAFDLIGIIHLHVTNNKAFNNDGR
jgi:hypothetical protein